MKKFYVVLAFLLALGASLVVAPMSMAAAHHSSVQSQLHHEVHSPGTFYYSLSTFATAGYDAGKVTAGKISGGLTLYIAADGTFTGFVSGNLHTKVASQVIGSFNADGSLQLHIHFYHSLTAYLDATLYPQRDGRYVGTFINIAGLNINSDTGSVALVPVENPQNVVAFHISALTTLGPDQTTGFGGVIILYRSGTFGTIRLQDGRVFPIVVHITQNTMTFTFFQKPFRFVSVTSTLFNPVTNEYSGTFVGPQSSDSGDWYGFQLAFVV